MKDQEMSFLLRVFRYSRKIPIMLNINSREEKSFVFPSPRKQSPLGIIHITFIIIHNFPNLLPLDDIQNFEGVFTQELIGI
jgi:hypothetical protein